MINRFALIGVGLIHNSKGLRLGYWHSGRIQGWLVAIRCGGWPARLCSAGAPANAKQNSACDVASQ